MPDDAALNLDPNIFVTAFENAPVGIGVCDEAGMLLAVNPRFAQLAGQHGPDMIGRPFLVFVHPGSRSHCLAGYSESVLAAVGNTAGRPRHAELRMINERTTWVAVSWTVAGPDGTGHQHAIVHLTDITVEHQTRAALADVRERAALAFRSAPIGSALLGLDGQFLETNPALRRLLGYSADEFGRLTLADLGHPDERDGWVDFVERLAAGTQDGFDAVRRLVRRDGTTVVARTVVSGLRNSDGSLRYLISHMEDVSNERRAREELRRHALRDPLTGLMTAEGLAYELELATAPRTLMVVDVVAVAPPAGPASTAQLIAALGVRLQANTRSDDLVARIAVGRFAVLVDPLGENSTQRLASRLSAALGEVVILEGRAYSIVTKIHPIDDTSGHLGLPDLLARVPADHRLPGV